MKLTRFSSTPFQNLIALVRPQSASKPSAISLRDNGVVIRLGDFAKDGISALEKYLEDVDILISLINYTVILDQKNLFQAAKNVGRVKRVIPCDFGTACQPGRRVLYDQASLPP